MAIEHKTIYLCDRCGDERHLPGDGRTLKLERVTHTYHEGGMVTYGAITAGSITMSGGMTAPKDRWLCEDCVDVLESFLRPEPDFTAGPEHPFQILPCAQGCPVCAAVQNTNFWKKGSDDNS